MRKLEEMEADEDKYSAGADACSLYFRCVALWMLCVEYTIQIRKRVKTSPLQSVTASRVSIARGAQGRITYLSVLVLTMCSL